MPSEELSQIGAVLNGQAALEPAHERPVQLYSARSVNQCHARPEPGGITAFTQDGPISEAFTALAVPRCLIPNEPLPVSPLKDSFPEKLDGAAVVAPVVEPAHPAIRLVHIKQTHWVDREQIREGMVSRIRRLTKEDIEADPKFKEWLGDSYRPEAADGAGLFQATSNFEKKIDILHREVLRAAEESQGNIAKTLGDLRHNHGVKDVYIEGYQVQRTAAMEKALEKMKDIMAPEQEANAVRLGELEKEAGKLRSQPPSVENAKRLMSCQSEIRTLQERQQVLEGCFSIVGAAGALHRRGELERILPCEEENALHAALEKTNQGIDTDADHNRREDAAVRIIDRIERPFGDGVAVVLFGREHSFADNVRKWNAEHPRCSIALTEISPIEKLNVGELSRKAIDMGIEAERAEAKRSSPAAAAAQR